MGDIPNHQYRHREQVKHKDAGPVPSRRSIAKPGPSWVLFFSRWRRLIGLGCGVVLAVILIVVVVRMTARTDENPLVTIEMEDGGKIVAELYPDKAPNTVHNFLSLAESGFYDETIIHRVVPGFVVQGGDPEGTGYGGPGYSVRGEFPANLYTQNDIEHLRGVLSMARSGDPQNDEPYYDTAGSQFFICVDDVRTSLDGKYAAFGKVIDGMELVDEIVNLPRDANDRPLNPPVIASVTVDTFGRAYPDPEKVS